MRPLILLLAVCLLPTSEAKGVELFADFLYWKATEPVDWVLETNRFPPNQYVTYRTVEYDFGPGLRVGFGIGDEINAKFSYTHFRTEASDAASGNLTAAFLGGKEYQPAAPKLYFDAGRIDTAINYNMFDWDLGRHFTPTTDLRIRPLVGLRAGWINQSITSGFQAEYPGTIGMVRQSVEERMKNDFWGIGPKFGLENMLRLSSGEGWEVNCIANFYTAYLLGNWQVGDVTNSTSVENGIATGSTKVVQVDGREFGALTFQAIVGFNVKYRNASATVGYEINDWLNQCQIFDDATGPHNNDLILQGLTANFGFSF